MLYLYKGITLTKANLARRNWQGDVKSYFCSLSEIVQLFFIVILQNSYNVLFVPFGIAQPNNFQHMFTD